MREGSLGDGREELVRIAKTTKWMRCREMYRLGLLEASEGRGGNTSADDGDHGHEPADSKRRSELAKGDIESA